MYSRILTTWLYKQFNKQNYPKCGISKGSLFKYFKSKEELYFYILDTVIMELTIDLEKNFADLPSDLFERTIKYSELEFAWYIKTP